MDGQSRSMQVKIAISYNQVCVFDPALEHPYNDWNAAQTEQGFSWRPGSVSLATQSADGEVTIEVQHGGSPPDAEQLLALIRVPFDVPSSGAIEVGSILSGDEVYLPAGSYALYFSHPLATDELFRLTFISAKDAQPTVLKGSAMAMARQSYDMSGSAA
jgi:hypothetical protein